MLTVVGPISIIWPVLITISLTCFLVLQAYRRKHLLEAFPSISWCLFMQLPFLLISSGFDPEIAKIQSIGIVLIATAFLLADGAMLVSRKANTCQTASDMSQVKPAFSLSLMSLVFLLPIYHASEAGDLPVLNLWFGQTSLKENAMNREAFGKLLEVPPIIKYSFNWVLSLFGPILIALLLRQNRPVIAGITFVWICIYALLSTANQPLILFVVFTGFATVGLYSNWLKAFLRLGWMFAIAAIAIIGVVRTLEITRYHNETGLVSASYAEYQSRSFPSDGLRNLTIGDGYRLHRTEREAGVMKVIDYLVYRTMLTPVEVSQHWYTYFGVISCNPRGIGELIGLRGDGVSHAANRVGLWAYHQRFPDQYGTSNSSYASVDADAYAFGGLFTVALCGFLLGVIRFVGGWAGRMVMGGVPGRVVAAQLGLFSISASLQAMLVAQGLVLLVALILVTIFIERFRGK